MLSISPEECLVDERISIKAKVQPFQHVTLRSEVVENNLVFDSYAHYVADDNGDIDLSVSPSYGGKYVGVDAMGIFWSMTLAKGEPLGSLYNPQDAMNNEKFKIQVSIIRQLQEICQ